MADGQEYLVDKLKSFLHNLRQYQNRLLLKKDQQPSLSARIQALLTRVRLEQSHLEQQLRTLQAERLPQSRIRYRTRIFINSYDQLSQQIDLLLAKKASKIHKDCSMNPQASSGIIIQKQRSKNDARSKQLRKFVENLNDTWMLDLLNQQKEKEKVMSKIRLEKYKHSYSSSQTKNHQKQKPKSAVPSTRKQGIQYLKKELICLEATAQRIGKEFEQHAHRDIHEEIQSLKQEQSTLVKSLQQAKEGNEILKEQFILMQRELESLRRMNHLMLEQREILR